MIDDLKKVKGMNPNAEKIALKKEELRKLEESNRSAWDTYGSELCAGDMSAKEKRLQDEIDLLEDNGENLNVV